MPTASNYINSAISTAAHPSFWLSPPNPRRNLSILRAFFWLIAALAAFLQAWSVHLSLSCPDSTMYLDIASAYLRHDWHNAINAYWSPFFSWLLAVALALFRPSPYWDSTIPHLLNFVGLLVALFCFEFFFSALLRIANNSASADSGSAPLPELVLWALGYGIFLSTSFFVLTPQFDTTPDVWLSAFTYLAAGLLLRIASGARGWRLFACLGLTLGLAYLTKSFYFPMAFIFLFAAWFACGTSRKFLPQLILATTVFLLIAGPWVAVLSHTKHRPTFGDVGKIAFVMTVDRVQQPFFWQGENATGTPVHPVRLLFASPRLFEFATPLNATYPPAFDMSYWMEGARPHFNLAGQLSVFRQSFGTLFQVFFAQAELAVALFVLIFLAPGPRQWLPPLRRLAPLWIPPLLACASYVLVLVEGRYIAPFLVILWAAAFFAFLPPLSGVSQRAILAIVLAALTVTGLRIAKSTQTSLTSFLAHPQNVDWEVSQALRAIGIQPGDRVAALGDIGDPHWARVAGVKIVSQIPLGQEGVFWSANEQTQRQVFAAFASTGAHAVITLHPSLCAADQGWRPLAQTGFFAHLVPSQGPSVQAARQ